MGYCFMAFDKLKTQADMGKRMEHNYRLEKVINADPEKSKLNKELVKLESESYWEAFKKLTSEKNIKQRKNSVLALEFMLTRTGTLDTPNLNEEEWEKKNVEWLEKTFGKENVVSAVCHYDESTPHIHAIVIPIHNERLNAKHFTGGKGACSELQTDYAKSMEAFGLQRGLKGSCAKHTDIKHFYAALNQELEKTLPPVERGESADEYRTRANAIYQDSNLKHLDEINKEKRKTVEAKTKLKEERAEFYREKELLDKEKEVIKSQYRSIAVNQKKADRLDEILGGLKNGCLPPEERDEFERKMKDIVNWERARIAETLEKAQSFGSESDEENR